MKKLFLLVSLIALGLLITACNQPTEPKVTTPTYTPLSDFVIESGVITDYIGSDSVVHIPPSITGIGQQAFSYIESLQTITIPSSVTTIGSAPFSGCSSLQSITVDSDNAHYESEGGVLYNKGKTELISYPVGNQRLEFIIPNSVTHIAGMAFLEGSSLQRIILPYGLTYIGYLAFFYCSSIQSIALPETVTTIEDSAFSGCSSLTSITIPNGVTAIKYNTFSVCSNLESITIPDSVTSIADNSFFGCDNLITVYTNYTKNNDGSSGGVNKYPTPGWQKGHYSDYYGGYANDDFFDATWEAIPVTL